ncbi:hypothetical protein ABPG74_021059 [Tetrahymena malaccensis]
MKQILLFLTLVAFTLAQVTNSVQLSNGFALTYQISSPNIIFTLTGSNQGYVALGFGGFGMHSIDAAAFRWDGTKVVGEDRTNLDNLQVVELDTDQGCVNNITVDPTSTYDPSTGQWNIKFSRPLNTNEANCDQIIQPETSQNLAFALFNDFTWQRHNSQNYWQLTFSANAQSNPTISTTSSQLTQLTYITFLFGLIILI